MIVLCPSCSARNDLPDRLNATALVDCSVCGHAWIEGSAIEISRAGEAPQHTYKSRNPAPEAEIRRLADAAREAQRRFAATRRQRRMRAAAWAGLALLAVSPAAGALAFPEQMVAAAPATIDFYRFIGRDVNIYGLEIRNLDIQHLLVDGKKVIAVKGELTNVTPELRRIPWLRLALRGEDDKEVYHWVINTESRPLKPGDSTSFITRLGSPPETANRLEIRFARADEIGSNDGS